MGFLTASWTCYRFFPKAAMQNIFEKTLSSFSENTVKTHVSHIYKKLNINSQQTLIDLVDDFEPVPQKPGENR